MPAALARSASTSPRRVAAATVAPLPPARSSASAVDAAASVRPESSSITCSDRCLLDRNTARRGRAAVPWIFLRTRRWRMIRPCRRCCATLLIVCSLLTGLAGLAEDLLAEVAHTLALVRLGLADRSDVGGHLADDFLVDAPDDHSGLDWYLEGDAFRRIDDHRVAEAQRHAQLVRRNRLGAIADADDLELFAEPIGDADDHVVDERARETVQRAALAQIVGALDQQLGVVTANRDDAGQITAQGALRALHRDPVADAAVDGDIDAARHRDWGFTDT